MSHCWFCHMIASHARCCFEMRSCGKVNRQKVIMWHFSLRLSVGFFSMKAVSNIVSCSADGRLWGHREADWSVFWRNSEPNGEYGEITKGLLPFKRLFRHIFLSKKKKSHSPFPCRACWKMTSSLKRYQIPRTPVWRMTTPLREAS